MISKITVLILAAMLAGCAKPRPEPEAKPQRVPAAIIEAIIETESMGRPRAIGPKGSIGLMQIKPATGRALGYSRQDLFDPEKNVAAGTAYLEMLLDQFDDDMHKALSAYNCGPQNWKRCQGYARRIMKKSGLEETP